jgi:hypothetical protein
MEGNHAEGAALPWDLPKILKCLLAASTLIPCFWTARIQAGDLSSHVYNSWLAPLIRQGRTPGLVIVPQYSNVLFDWMLDALPHRIAVALAVLIFAGGAFAFVSRFSRLRPWHLLPIIAVLAYGWVFRMGFFNFYLSLGLCLWALALAWDRRGRIAWIAAPLLAVAWLAHLLPVIWTVAAILYPLAARRWHWTPWAALAAILAADAAIRIATDAHWFSEQLYVLTGADQAYIYNGRYAWPVTGLLLLFLWLLLRLVRAEGWRKLSDSLLFQLTVLSGAAIAILPTAITSPGFHAAFLANRMSLAVAVCLCALVAAVEVRTIEWCAAALVAALFFGLSYIDERQLNALEDQFDAVVSTLPAGSRVVNALYDPTLHVDAVVHMIDRACVGHCYSFANYEAGTRDFRIRALAPNTFVAATYLTSWQLQQGRYTVQPADLPLYVIDLDGALHTVARPTLEGPLRGLTPITALY